MDAGDAPDCQVQPAYPADYHTPQQEEGGDCLGRHPLGTRPGLAVAPAAGQPANETT